MTDTTKCHKCGSRRAGLIRDGEGPYICAECVFARVRELEAEKEAFHALLKALGSNPENQDEIARNPVYWGEEFRHALETLGSIEGILKTADEAVQMATEVINEALEKIGGKG